MATRKAVKKVAKKTVSARKSAKTVAKKPVRKAAVVSKNTRGVALTEVKIRDIVKAEVAETVKSIMVDVLKEFGITKAPAKPNLEVVSSKPSPEPQAQRYSSAR